MDNETRIKITNPDVPEGPEGKIAKGFFATAAALFLGACVWVWVERFGVRKMANIVHKIFHHFVPHVEDKNSEDMLDS